MRNKGQFVNDKNKEGGNFSKVNKNLKGEKKSPNQPLVNASLNADDMEVK